jgi:hypothetical protein
VGSGCLGSKWVTGEGGHEARPYDNRFFVGATLVVALRNEFAPTVRSSRN